MELRIAVDVGRHAVKTAADRVPAAGRPVTTWTPTRAWVGPQGQLRCGASAQVMARRAPEGLLTGWVDKLWSHAPVVRAQPLGASGDPLAPAEPGEDGRGPADDLDGVDADGSDGPDGEGLDGDGPQLSGHEPADGGATGAPADDTPLRAADVLARLLGDPVRDTVQRLARTPGEVTDVTALLVVGPGWSDPAVRAAQRVLQDVVERACPQARVVVETVEAGDALAVRAGMVELPAPDDPDQPGGCLVYTSPSPRD